MSKVNEELFYGCTSLQLSWKIIPCSKNNAKSALRIMQLHELVIFLWPIEKTCYVVAHRIEEHLIISVMLMNADANIGKIVFISSRIQFIDIRIVKHTNADGPEGQTVTVRIVAVGWLGMMLYTGCEESCVSRGNHNLLNASSIW